MAQHQTTVRAIHERLFFRPLLEIFSTGRAAGAASAAAGRPETGQGSGAGQGGLLARAAHLAPSAVNERLAAFGFSDATRTRDAVVELTQGFSRTSRLMRTMVPLLLDWLSESPDPDLGLLGLRRLATGPHRRTQLSNLFRESPEAARHLCLLLGTSPLFATGYERHPDQLALLGTGLPSLPRRGALERRALDGIAWRPRPEWWRGLASLVRGELLRAQARDVLGLAELPETARSLTDLAESVLHVALSTLADEASAGPVSPGAEGMAVVAMGRFGGADLAYSSDLDIMFVFDDEVVAPDRAEHRAEAFMKLVNGDTPVHRLYELDLSLRPEGRKGPLARSLKAFETYYDRWAQVWERQALTRGRVVAGDASVGERFAALAGRFVWDKPLSDDDVRQIPPDESPG